MPLINPFPQLFTTLITPTLLSSSLIFLQIMERKKRGVVTYGGHHHDDDDSGDEAKMEKFYSLLRRFRDARDRRKSELKEMENNNQESNVINKKAKTAEVSFVLQDFTTEIEFRKPPLVFPNPVRCDAVTDAKKGKKEQRQQDRPLDLKLAL
ncbi:hypothetical protein PIB30_007907 [Stylosanthes scabra]|uniref:Uncharacterized protein n=1 Tax=Stylosanthes scabra TaxID=79078 RepID=A0ABU6S547_9FABA|nr:hypothetical protein [Stylosanthes scabra]